MQPHDSTHIVQPELPFSENIIEYAPWVAKYGLRYEYGKCQCGCNGDAPIAKATSSKSRGLVKGLPGRYLPRHQCRLPPQESLNSSGMCMCGCGEPVPLAKKTRQIRKEIKGQPLRYIPGHKSLFTLSERFWEKVSIAGVDDCWEWQASVGTGGYGKVSVNGKHTKAARVCWMLMYGEIPEGMYICHTCDNPKCVNPAHLFLGTPQDNVDDKIKKGRQSCGEQLWNTKLDAASVVKIRALWTGGMSQTSIAELYNVSNVTIFDIVRYRTWNHIP